MSEINHTERAHSEIGASSASRWLNCPASVERSRGIEDKTSEYASEGTAAHECSEYCFENDIDARDCIGMEFNGFTVDEEMAGHVQYYVDNMRQYINSEEYDTLVEEKFNLPNIHEDMFGSNDFCAMGNTNGELVIADFKYGKGINVKAEGNIQLIIYALGAYHESNFIYNFTKVKLVVVQPRIEGEEWDEWNISVEELLEYEARLKEGVKQVYSDSPPAKAGDHCKFCRAKATCKTLKEKTEEVITTSFDSMPIEKPATLPEPSTLDKETIIKVLNHSKLIEDWMKEVAQYAHTLLEKGEEIEGFKLVKKRSNRKVNDEKELISSFGDTFGDKLYQKKLITLSSLEKLIGKKELEPFLIKPDMGNQIAPMSDKRPAIEVPKIDDAFEEADLEDLENW